MSTDAGGARVPENGSPVAGLGHPCLAWLVGSQSYLGRLCGVVDKDKPMAFRGEDWCSENHRKLIVQQGDSS